MYFLLLHLQLGFHVRKRSLNLLKILVCLCVCDIEVFVFPFFLSVEVRWTRDQRDESVQLGGTAHVETRSNPFSIVSA